MKRGTDDPFAGWFEEQANQLFYDNYQRDFFSTTMAMALLTYESPKEALGPLDSPRLIRDKGADTSLRVALDVQSLDAESLRRAARLQILNLYHHAAETVIRLLRGTEDRSKA